MDTGDRNETDNSNHSIRVPEGKPRAKAFFLLGVAGIAAAGICAVWWLGVHSCRQSAQSVEDIARAFQTGTVTTEFREYCSDIETYNRLQVSTYKQTESFTRETTKAILWRNIFSTAKVEIIVPVEYTYYVELGRKWDFYFEDRDRTVTVFAPEIKWNTPAVNLSDMVIRNLKSGILIDEQDMKNKLLRQITDAGSQRAENKITIIRPSAREMVKKFVEDWLLAVQFENAEFKPVVKNVFFADEKTYDENLKRLKHMQGEYQ